MAIIKETVEGTKIIVEIESSNLSLAEYNNEKRTLTVTFKSNAVYEYADVPLDVFTKLRMNESQGKYFNKEIARKYEYKKIK